MAEGEWDELIDSLSPYEIAVWTCASVPSQREMDAPEGNLLVVGKQAALWAGAVAHVLVRNPSLEREQILKFLREAVNDVARREPEVLRGHRLKPSYSDPGLTAIEFFLRHAGVEENINVVVSRTEAAMRSLEWRGLIEDPFSKKFRTLALSILLLMPVHFNNPEPGTLTVDTITWSYAQRTTQKDSQPHVKREFNFKVKEFTEAVLKKIVPTFEDILAGMATPAGDAVMTIADVQKKLAGIGYYRGPIDGKSGPKTVEALRQFQRDRYLEVTGHPDPATVKQLRRS